MSKKSKIISVISAGVALGTAYLAHECNTLKITRYDVHSPKIKDDIKIVHLSDLHTKEFGRNNKELIDRIKVIAPDIICITGDLTDEHSPLLKGEVYTTNLINILLTIAPVYYVTGNHEIKSYADTIVRTCIEDLGGTVLSDQVSEIKIGNNTLLIGGCEDFNHGETTYTKTLEQFDGVDDKFNLFLVHKPDYFDDYSIYNADLILAGHSHGGQIRLPLVGGVFKPERMGFFPKYQLGRYTKNGTEMIVSGGLGTSALPIRTFNKPEIVVVTLKPEEEIVCEVL